MIENIANRIFRNWKTTTLSLMLMAGSISLLYYDAVDWKEWSILMTAACAFLFTKDPKKKKLEAMSGELE